MSTWQSRRGSVIGEPGAEGEGIMHPCLSSAPQLLYSTRGSVTGKIHVDGEGITHPSLSAAPKLHYLLY